MVYVKYISVTSFATDIIQFQTLKKIEKIVLLVQPPKYTKYELSNSIYYFLCFNIESK